MGASMATTEKEIASMIQTDVNSPSTNKAIVEQALTQMNFTESAKKLLLDPNYSLDEVNSIQSITLTQEHLSQVKKSLGAIVDSLQENPSLISRAAAFWGEIPLWQRILGGVVISGPTLVIGAAAHIGFLVTISGVSALAYTTSGIVLDDHHYHTQNIAQKLKQGIFGIAEVLELTIGALDAIRKKLAIEVDKFKEENEKLAENIKNLHAEVTTLSAQIEVYVETEKLLRKTKENLELVTDSLKKDLANQNQLLTENQEEIALIKEAHAKSIFQLSAKVAELAEVRTLMGAEVDKAKKIASTLEGAVKTLSGVIISDTNYKQAFQEKLNGFLKDKTTSFDQVAIHISKAESELSDVKTELQASNDRYKKLLICQEEQIRRLERLDHQVDASVNEEPLSPLPTESITFSGLLSSFGLMAFPQKIWTINSSTREPAKSTPAM